MQLTARKGPADIDIFVVAPDDASAHAAFTRLFSHLRTRLGAATAWSSNPLQAPPDEDGNAGAAANSEPRPAGLVIRPWPDRDEVENDLAAQQMGEGIDNDEEVERVFARLLFEDLTPTPTLTPTLTPPEASRRLTAD